MSIPTDLAKLEAHERSRWFYNVSFNLLSTQLSRDAEGKLISDIAGMFSEMPYGGRLMIDFNGVESVSSIAIRNFLASLIDSKGCKRISDKYLAIKDPNEDVRRVLELELKEIHGSVTIYDSSKKAYEIAGNLPKFLATTLDIVIKEGEMTSNGLNGYFESGRKLNGREYLHLLHKKRRG